MKKSKLYIARFIRIVFIMSTVTLLFYLYLPPSPSVIDLMNNTVGKNRVDVIFLGSSHVFNGVIPKMLYKDKGIASYDIAVGAQSPWQTYCYLKEIKKSQNPRLVILETYMFGCNSDDSAYQDYQTVNNLLDLPLSINKVEALGASVADSKLNILLHFPYTYSRYYDFQGLTFNKRSGYDYNLGYKKRTGVEVYDEVFNACSVTNVKPLNEKNELYLRKCIEYCKDNDIELLLTVVPWPCITEEIQEHFNYIDSISSQYGVIFINGCLLSDEIGMDYTQDSYGDGGHLNYIGAEKYTRWLSEYLSEHYDLPDRRGQVEYDDCYLCEDGQ